MKRWLKRILLGTVVLVLVGWILAGALLNHWTAKPPPLPADVSVMQLNPTTREGRTWLGQSWVTRREGLLVVRLKGAPFDMGYASGVLLPEQIHALENEFLTMVKGYVPQTWKLNLLKSYVIYRNRNLSEFVPLDYQSQIHGATLGCPDTHPELGDYYNRLLNYHAAHDISYMMIDNPLVSPVGCTAFGAWGQATENGRLITGRNFDWEAAEVFSRDRVVILCEPDNGIPFASLAWAGMTGVVSGMNRAGVSITINGAPSSLPSETATPVAMVGRDVLQKARNLDEALSIIRDSKVFVSTLWLVGSRADGRFVVVEKTPTQTVVLEPKNDTIVCANHFEAVELNTDQRNQNYLTDGTSGSRHARMTELLDGTTGRLNPALAAELLRDRKLPGGQFAGNGHRATLNAFIATHATVMDLSTGIFWAASPPNQLGQFVAFDVNDFDRELPQLTVSADAVMAGGEFERTQKARQCLVEARRSLKDQDAAAALKQSDQAELLNPGYYENAALRGRALLALGQSEAAASAFKAALDARPAFQHEQAELETLLQQARTAR